MDWVSDPHNRGFIAKTICAISGSGVVYEPHPLNRSYRGEVPTIVITGYCRVKPTSRPLAKPRRLQKTSRITGWALDQGE